MRRSTLVTFSVVWLALPISGALRAQWPSLGTGVNGEGEVVVESSPDPDMLRDQTYREGQKPQRRAGTQPFRLRQPQNLRAGRFASQFRYEENADDNGLFVSGAYGVFDDLMIHAQVSSGHQYETISWAAAPGPLFDIGIQYAIYEDREFVLATRLDVVLSDESSFEAIPREVSRVSFQPSLLVNAPICDGLDLYVNNSVRIGDGVETAFAGGFGLLAPLGKINVFLETDVIAQQRDGGKDILEAYFTPGVQFVLRDKVDVSLSPSIGLSSTSYDWRFSVTMGVHF